MASRMILSPARRLANVVGTRSITTQVVATRCATIKDEITHTGQYYEENDYRNVRFVNATKVVNPNWAIKLIDELPIVKSEQRVVCCDGGTDPALGHPKVYINLVKTRSSIKICVVKMDLLKKFMGLDGRKDDDDDNRKKKSTLKDEFRKPIWVEEDDSDDELFDNRKIYGVQIFTNPIEMQKYFEQQMQEMWKSLDEYDENVKLFDHDLKQDFLKPGFEEAIRDMDKQVKPQDTDLDGEIYADQLHSLLQRISPDLKELMPKKRSERKKNAGPSMERRKLTDEEKVMDLIHGITEQKNLPNNGTMSKPFRRHGGLPQRFPEGGLFEGAFQGPRMFGQSIISQTIRRPDGSYETRRTVRDSEGNTQTTVTLSTKDGRKETVTTYDEGGKKLGPGEDMFGMKKGNGGGGGDDLPTGALLALDGKFGLNNNGYVLPKNLW
uniref:Zinc finger CHCC-type domain-containing protein n=1 Tax=Anopheles epiroticus TaxID=199890 RepID=A0A182PDG0_9DIPT